MYGIDGGLLDKQCEARAYPTYILLTITEAVEQECIVPFEKTLLDAIEIL